MKSTISLTKIIKDLIKVFERGVVGHSFADR